MTVIEFETPTLNDKGEVIARTRHSAAHLRVLQSDAEEVIGFRVVCDAD